MDNLRNTYNDLAFTLESAQIATFDLNPGTGKFKGNERLKHWFGLVDENEFVVEEALAVIIDSDRQRVREAIEKVLQFSSGGVYDVSYAITDPNNLKLRHVRVKGKVIFNGDHEAIRFSGIIQDVSDQVEARQKLERAEQMLQFAVEAADIGTFIIDSETRSLIASPRLKELFGFMPDEDLPYNAGINQITDEYKDAVREGVEAAFQKGEDFNMEYKIKGLHNQKLRWVKSVGKLGKTGIGENTIFAGAIIDITEQKQDETRKNDFIGMVSHELKTPLTSLSLILQILAAKLSNNEDTFISGAIDKASAQVKKMVIMINGFLNVSRLESGKIHINKKRFNMMELISEMVKEGEVTFPGHQFRIAIHDKIPVHADYEKIGTVISNLLSNAAKYSGKGKVVDINCKVIDGKVSVSIKDEGVGIMPQHKQKLFSRFYRVENNDTSLISGFGIGLYLSAEIISRHDGTIWVDSEIGEGSTFYFELPQV